MSYSQQLLDALRSTVWRLIGSERAVAISYSGGLDSSVIARLASERSAVRAHSCVIPSSFDARNVATCAAQEGLDLELIELSEHELREAVIKSAETLGTTDPVKIAYTIPVLCVIERCEERLVLAGNGADELFGGYAKYASMADPRDAMSLDMGKMMDEAKRLRLAAESLRKEIAFPFVSHEVVTIAEGVPLHEKVSARGRKLVLRDVARALNLPSYTRPKKAAQYSSGVMKEMERQAKAEGMSLGQWTRAVASGS